MRLIHRLVGMASAALISIWALAAASCAHKSGPALYPVKGTAIYDGSPAAGAVLTFHRVGDSDKTNLPHAVVATDGSFSLTTFEPGDGAAAGKYAITVIWRKKGKRRGDNDDGGWRLPQRYLTPELSGLTAEVKEGPTELPPIILKN
jgi:hypothetical protein